jgi:hypothetical protein
MSAEIIQFAAAARPARKAVGKPSSAEITDERINDCITRALERREKLPPPATETAKNSRIRIKRRDVWWHAGRVADYWCARLDWQAALECAQSWGVADSGKIQPAGTESRYDLVDKWREAVVKQLLTPATDLAAITWKRAKLAGRGFSHLPVTRERVDQAIADDVAFLTAHPTRKPSGKPCKKPGPKGKAGEES